MYFPFLSEIRGPKTLAIRVHSHETDEENGNPRVHNAGVIFYAAIGDSRSTRVHERLPAEFRHEIGFINRTSVLIIEANSGFSESPGYATYRMLK